MEFMKPHIDYTEFGQINIDGKVFEYDVVIRLDGTLERRNKKLSKRVYGTSHTLSVDEAKDLYEAGAEYLIIGSGQYGVLELSPEAANFLKEKGITITIDKTPESAEVWNELEGNVIGLFHVTC
jgi:hypothetical protein